jgi:hypothetical protein
MTSDSSFHRRANDRAKRLAGLVKLFQDGEIPVKKFRYLTTLLKSEHQADCRASGWRVESQFK